MISVLGGIAGTGLAIFVARSVEASLKVKIDPGLVLVAAGGTMIGVSLRKQAPASTAGLVLTPGGGAISGTF